MLRNEKEALVASLNETFKSASLVVVSHYSGLSVSEMESLRAKVREADAGFKVTKNRLAKIAIEGTDFGDMGELFKGPTAITYSADPIAAAKVTTDFAKDNEKLQIVGGAFGSQILDAKSVEALAKLPSLDELRSKLVGLLQAPAQQIVTVTQAPATQLARVFQAYADQGEAA
ncbi:MAG: 50S ribosomal protein L10 [Alphaproteobacteria bacterium]|nr:50S ribosomal protein L10 [Alphaproteobacteria bacterium SS10]